MYRSFLSQVAEVVGYDQVGWVLMIAPVVVLVSMLVLGGRAWQKRIMRLDQTPGRWPLIAGFLVNLLRLAAGVVGVLFLSAMLFVQADLFTEEHGRVTQRNYNAVTTKWGRSHEQRELNVQHHVWEIETIETFAGGAKRRVVEATEIPPSASLERQVLSDETFTMSLDKEGKVINPMQLVRRVKTRIRRRVEQDSIIAGIIDIQITSTPRYLGGAGYAGFEDVCDFQYTVVNRSDKKTRATFRFPLPGEGYGLFDNLSVKVNDKALSRELRYQEGSLVWQQVMEPRERLRVRAGYTSRGLEYFRYWPGNLREKYLVNMQVKGIPRERLNFPIGSMSPDTDLATLKGETYVLKWDLSSAVTNFSIGIIVPSPKQPGIQVARLLREAPPGLMLLVVSLTVTRLLLGVGASLFAVGLSATSHYLGYAAFSHISDHVADFFPAIAFSMGLAAAMGLVFWLVRDGRSLSGVQSGVLHVLFTLGYPLAVYWENTTGTVLHTGYILLVGYLMFLAAQAWRRDRLSEEGVAA